MPIAYLHMNNLISTISNTVSDPLAPVCTLMNVLNDYTAIQWLYNEMVDLKKEMFYEGY